MNTKWKSVLWSDASTFQIVGNHGHHVLWAKTNHPDGHLHKVSICDVWGVLIPAEQSEVTFCGLCSKGMLVLDWPACSPDLSPIEKG